MLMRSVAKNGNTDSHQLKNNQNPASFGPITIHRQTLCTIQSSLAETLLSSVFDHLSPSVWTLVTLGKVQGRALSSG